LRLELLRSVGIHQPERRVATYPHEFSAGMRQRVRFAMASPSETRTCGTSKTSRDNSPLDVSRCRPRFHGAPLGSDQLNRDPAHLAVL